MTNNQLAENSITQLLNSVKLARDNAERDDNRVDHSFYYALTIALEELQERRKADSEPVATLDVQSRRPDGNKFALVFSSAAHKLPDDVYFLYRHAQPDPVAPTFDQWPRKLSWSYHDNITQAEVEAWNSAIDACRAAMLRAQSDDDGEPTDDERIMAIEGIHNCERCGDEGLAVGEMGITRCACGQAGNSPVIPDRWIPVSERMPDVGDIVLTAMGGSVNVGEMERSGANYRYFTSVISGREFPVTHWMALPTAPQEASNEK